MKKYFAKIKNYWQRHRWSLVWLRILQEIRIIDHDFNLAYAQEGEDLILNSYFFKKGPGLYVDVGANHPKKFSSTHLFYLHHWQGINIDPWPEAKKLFAKHRPRDIFVNCGIADIDGSMDYYCFKSSLMNTFDAAQAKNLESDSNEGCRLQNVQKVRVRKLQDVLNENEKFIAGRPIDVMNIDVEGGELGVLQSNDWEKYEPGFIAIEMHGLDLLRAQDFPVHNFLVSKGYDLVAKTQITAIYKHQNYGV